jgi:hypothetical protein
MSEKIYRSPEMTNVYKKEIHIEAKNNQEKSHNSEYQEPSNIESFKKNVEAQSISKEQFPQNKSADDQLPHMRLTKQLKLNSYRQTLAQTRKHLSKFDTKASELIHQPKIEHLSEIGSKTIARPISLISGALTSLILGITVLFIAKTNGFYINRTIWILLFILGYIIGLFIELFLKLIMKTREHRNRYI